ncbi:MAG: hypothetical protein V4635_12485 [Bacteroidota bacterium]
MKKIFILVLALCAGRVFSQVSIPPSPFGFTSGAGGFTVTSADWFVDNGTAPVIPCNVAGSSGTNLFLGSNAATNGSVQRLVSSSINTGTFINIFVSWNSLKANASSPAVTFEWSNDAGSTWNLVSYTNNSANNVWAAVSPVALPIAASGTNIALRWTYTATASGGANYVAIDDINVTGTPIPSYYWDGAGALTATSAWWTSPGGVGINPPDFTSGSQNFFLLTTGAVSSATLGGNWTVSGANSYVYVGDGTVLNRFDLTIPSGFALTIGNGAGTDAKLIVSGNSGLVIANATVPNSADVTLSTNSTVEFSQSAAVNLWGGQTFNYSNLTLSGAGNKNQNGDLNVNGNFIIKSGCSYVMESNIFRSTVLSGSISCLGNITQGLSRININGSSTIGTINFNGSGGITNFTLNRTGQTLTLGSSLTVNGIAAFTNGNFALNGNALTLSGAITFPVASSNGSLTGSATSTLTINGSGTITNNLLMAQSTNADRTLNGFTIDRSGVTLTLGNNLIVTNANFTNGSISLNDRILNLNGPATFQASSSNGVFIGSDQSTFSITTSGALSNSLFMSQSTTSSKTLGRLVMNRSGSTLVLGTDLILGSSAGGQTSVFTAGFVDINGHLLNVTGPVTWPTAAPNGLKGSLTSTLTLSDNGSGNTITNSLFMDQTSALSRALASLNFDRSSVTLTLGNKMEVWGEVNLTNGDINSNSNLYLRSDATNKGRITTIPGGSSITGTVNVETFALGGTTGWTNLGPSGINGLKVSSWDNQIPMTCVGCVYSPTVTGNNFVSIRAFEENANQNTAAAYPELIATDNLNPAEGYWVYFGNGNLTTTDITYTVAGTVTQGAKILGLLKQHGSKGNGFNLVSNPYPCPIDWDQIYDDNVTASSSFSTEVSRTIYVYVPGLGHTSYVNGVSSHTAGITKNIPMGQGFYIQALVDGTQVNVQESQKISNNQALLKTTNTNIGNVIRLVANGGGSENSAAIRFHSDATTGFDAQFDAKTFDAPTGVLSISTKVEGVEYSINSIPNAKFEDAVIPVVLKHASFGSYTITGTDLQNLPNSCVELKDKLTNTVHNLKAGPYVFNVAANSDSETRFELRVCSDITMSVDETKLNEQNVFISQDNNGVYVKLNYAKSTKSTISVTNILGQQVIDTKSVTVENDVIRLNVPEKNQILFVTVTSEDSKVTKKIVR